VKVIADRSTPRGRSAATVGRVRSLASNQLLCIYAVTSPASNAASGTANSSNPFITSSSRPPTSSPPDYPTAMPSSFVSMSGNAGMGCASTGAVRVDEQISPSRGGVFAEMNSVLTGSLSCAIFNAIPHPISPVHETAVIRRTNPV